MSVGLQLMAVDWTNPLGRFRLQHLWNARSRGCRTVCKNYGYLIQNTPRISTYIHVWHVLAYIGLAAGVTVGKLSTHGVFGRGTPHATHVHMKTT